MMDGLLYLGADSSRVLPDYFSRKWKLHVAHSIPEAHVIAAESGARIGLASIDGLQRQLDPLQELILGREPMEWIALLSRDSLDNGEVCRMIAECFFDYHTLPSNPGQLAATIGHAIGKSRIKARIMRQRDVPGGEYEMVGTSPPMQQLFRDIRKIAATDVPVLITGESGTGKELTAQAIRERSSRRNAVFMTLNCGALPPNLVQSELFGYEKGAFTGATERKIGRIEAASGGTLFLDEIGELPLDQQVNLLRFLQERRIQRIGSSGDVTVNVRVIAATNVNLEKAMLEGRFREDLYYRLSALQVRVPALRERPEDIEVLARFFFDQFRPLRSTSVRGFSRHALHAMRSYSWPGNVRELINRVRRAVVMCEGRLIGTADLGLDKAMSQHKFTLAAAKENAEREAIALALRHTENNISRTARYLDVSRVTLYRMIDKYQIRLAAFLCLADDRLGMTSLFANWVL